MTELARVKQYFDKIEVVENAVPPAERKSTLNTEAAVRFLKANLVGILICSLPPRRLRSHKFPTFLGRRKGAIGQVR